MVDTTKPLECFPAVAWVLEGPIPSYLSTLIVCSYIYAYTCVWIRPPDALFHYFRLPEGGKTSKIKLLTNARNKLMCM